MLISGSDAKYKVFVSYAHVDTKWRDDVCRFLEKNGFEPIFDSEKLDLGKPWRPQLKSLIDEADSMLVLFSGTSVESEWVLFEFVWGLAKDKSPIFLAKEKVKIPDPVSDIQGQILDLDTIITDMDKVATALQQISNENRQKRISTTLPKLNEATSEWVETQFDRRMKDDEVVEALVNRHLQVTITRPDLNPSIEVLQQTISALPRNIATKVYLSVIQKELSQNDNALRKSNISAEQFQFLHRKQWSLGELLSQLTIDEPLHFWDWSQPHSIDSNKFKMSKYPITVGLYNQYQKEVFKKRMSPSGDAGKPYLIQVDGMKQGSILEKNLREDIEKLGEWLREKDPQIRRIRLPTRKEWLSMAQPEVKWDKKTLSACNLTSDNVYKTDLATVGTYRASRSRHDCYDIMGNSWELCLDNDDWYVAGWSYKNGVQSNEIHRNWDDVIELDGKAVGEPVAIRLIAEI
jgi:hypothetical protein